MRSLLLSLIILVLHTLDPLVGEGAVGEGTAWPNGVQVNVTGLRSRAVMMSANGVRLRHPAAARNPDTLLKHDVLRFWCFVPQRGELLLDIEPATLRKQTTIVRRGSYGGEPMAMITIDPFMRTADGGILCVDTLQVRGTWTDALRERVYRVPPSTGPVLNPTWGVPPVASAKAVEQAQGGLDPSAWYDPSQPHARIETSRNGIAAVTAQDVLATEPELGSTPLGQLRLLYRGAQQPIHVVDTDGNNLFSSGDTLMFVGRQARGDTAWMDLADTVAVFFLTRRSDGAGRRIAESDTIVDNAPTIPHVLVRERFEVDSGYYHPGSGRFEDYSTFFTPMSLFEGFYWRSLNGRARQSVGFLLPFVPSRQDSFLIRADVVASTDVVSMTPDHGIDLRTNGGPSVRVEGDGFQRYTIDQHNAGASSPAVLQSARIYASGVSGSDQKPEWFSEVLIDALEINGAAAPVLLDGRLAGRVTVGSGGGQVRVSNAQIAPTVAIDTTTWTLRRFRRVQQSISARTGASRMNTGLITDPRSTSWQMTLAMNDSVVSWPDAAGTAIAISSVAGTTFRQSRSADSVVDLLAAAPAEAVVAILHAGAAPSQRLIDLLRARGTALRSSDSVWSWIGRADSTFAFSVGSDVTCGALSDVPAAWSMHGVFRCDVPGPAERHLIIGSGTGIERARVVRSHLSDLRASRDTLAASDVIVITHDKVRASANRWAAYRSAASNRTIRVVDVASIHAEYDAGRRSAEALREFLSDVWLARPDRRLTHVVLFGSASWDVRGVTGTPEKPVRPDLVPTYGRPSSDYWFGLLDDPSDVAVPELIVSRFPVLNDAEANAIIDKVIQHDTSAYAPADRTALYVGGGETLDEGLCDIYRNLLDDVFGTGIRFTDVPLCLDTLTVCKSLDATPGLDIRRHLASGVGIMNYIGHGGTEVFDIEGWDPKQLANSRYPILGTFSCLTGAFSNPTALCRNGQYLIEPSRGVVAAMGATGWQYILVISQLHISQHEVLRSLSIRDVGRLMYAMKRGFGEMGQQFATNAVLQFNLLGDPFTRIRIDTIPEVSIAPDRVTASSPSGSQQIREDDRQMNLNVRIWNEGLGTTSPLSVRIRRTYRGITDSSTVTLNDGICRDATVTFVLDVVEKVGDHQIEIIVDPDQRYGDRQSNNYVRMTVPVFARSLLVLEPVAYQQVRTDGLRMRMIDVVSTRQQPMMPRVVLTRRRDTSSVIMRSAPQEFTRTGSIIDWVPASVPTDIGRGDRWLATWAVDNNGISTAITWVPVHVSPDAADGVRRLRVSPLMMGFSSDSVAYDTTADALVPGVYQRSVYVRSHGTMTPDPDRDPILEVRVGDSVIVRSAFRTGLNVFTLQPQDTVPRRVRRFDTSPTPAPASTHNGFALECISFLRDSVTDEERVIIAACEESFSRFVKDSLRDELVVELKRFGARTADSINIGSSYAFVGSRQTGQSPPLELWRSAQKGSVTIDSAISIAYSGALVRSPVIGPVQQWNDIVTNIRGGARCALFGIRQDQTEVLLDTAQSIDAASIPRDVVGIRFEWTMHGTNPRVGSLDVNATPLPQWIIEPYGLTLMPSKVIRGDTTIMQVAIRNARTSETTPQADLAFDIVDAATMIAQPLTAVPVASIGPNQLARIDLPLATSPLPTQPIARATLRLDQQRQQYAVRDRCEAAVDLTRDSIPPSIDVFVSGRRVVDADRVPALSAFEIRVNDNARLPISDPENVVVFVNGTRIRSTTAAGYEFIGTDSAQTLFPGSDTRAIVRFRFPLEDGENLLIVRATDAFQNVDTLELSLYPVDDVIIANPMVMPNPTGGATTVRADVIANAQDLDVQLLLSDAQGQLVRTMTAPIEGSTVTFVWDGRSQENESLASGLYAWRLLVKQTTGSVLKTVSGTLLILR